jgi:hypothetical protein
LLTKETDMSTNRAADAVEPLLQELADRRSGTLHVRLLWNPSENTVEIELAAGRERPTRFVVDRARALFAFYHPYAYAAEMNAACANALRLPAAA